jgi:hypothetical protein
VEAVAAGFSTHFRGAKPGDSSDEIAG